MMRFIGDNAVVLVGHELLDACAPRAPECRNRGHNERIREDSVHVGVAVRHLDAYAQVWIPPQELIRRLSCKLLTVNQNHHLLAELHLLSQRCKEYSLAQSGSQDAELSRNPGVVAFADLGKELPLIWPKFHLPVHRDLAFCYGDSSESDHHLGRLVLSPNQSVDCLVVDQQEFRLELLRVEQDPLPH